MFPLFKDKRQHRRIGDAHRDGAEWGLAAEAYRRHLEGRPNDVAIWIQLGHAEKEAHRIAEAEAAYQRAVALAPDDPDALLHLSHLLKRQGRFDEAFVAFTRLARLSRGQEVLSELNQLMSKRRTIASVVALPGAVLFTMEDFFNSFRAGSAASDLQRVQAGVILSAIESPACDAHFIVSGGDESGNPTFLRLKDDSVREILDYVLSRNVDHPKLLNQILLARLNATPIRLGAGSTIVILGSLWGFGAQARHYLEAKRDGARLVAFIQDAIPATYPEFCDVNLSNTFWRALAELLHIADFLLTNSDSTQQVLKRFIAEHGGRMIPMQTVLPAPSRDGRRAPATAWLGAIGNTRRSCHRENFMPRNWRDVGEDVVGKLMAMLAADLPVAKVTPVLLREGIVFRPGEMVSKAWPVGDYFNSPMGLVMTPGFYEAESGGSWMRGRSRELTFQTALDADCTIVVFVAVKPARWAAGRNFSLTMAGGLPGQRRWAPLADGTNLLRIEGPVAADGTCTLLLTCDHEPAMDAAGPRHFSVALIALGYSEANNWPMRTELRENLLFTA